MWYVAIDVVLVCIVQHMMSYVECGYRRLSSVYEYISIYDVVCGMWLQIFFYICSIVPHRKSHVVCGYGCGSCLVHAVDRAMWLAGNRWWAGEGAAAQVVEGNRWRAGRVSRGVPGQEVGT